MFAPRTLLSELCICHPPPMWSKEKFHLSGAQEAITFVDHRKGAPTNILDSTHSRKSFTVVHLKRNFFIHFSPFPIFHFIHPTLSLSPTREFSEFYPYQFASRACHICPPNFHFVSKRGENGKVKERQQESLERTISSVAADNEHDEFGLWAHDNQPSRAQTMCDFIEFYDISSFFFGEPKSSRNNMLRFFTSIYLHTGWLPFRTPWENF